jgi:hypothetical protein
MLQMMWHHQISNLKKLKMVLIYYYDVKNLQKMKISILDIDNGLIALNLM